MVADAAVTPGAGASDAQAPAGSSARSVQIIDSPEARVHRLTDVFAMLGTVLMVVVVLLLGAYAQATSAGITQDIQGVSSLLQRLLVAPVNIFSGIVTLVIPATIIISLGLRREPRRILEVLGAAIGGFALTGLAAVAITAFGSDHLLTSLSVADGQGAQSLQMPVYIAAVAAMLTAAGRRNTRRSLAISWNILWIAVAVAVISGIVTVPAALVTIFVGRFAGLILRYALGSTADRAYGDALVDAIRKAGFEPKKLVRADSSGEYEPPTLDDISQALGRTRLGRVYAITTRENHHLIAVALDGDQHAAGLVAKWWSSVRLRGINARADVSLRHSAEAMALVSHAARGAGVHTARVLGMSQVHDTIVIVYQRPAATRPFGDLPPEDVTDLLLDSLWSEIEKAHVASITHRDISGDTVLIGHDDLSGDPVVWLSSWELGEVASSELARRIDRGQVLAMMAAKVGAHRAVDSAFRRFRQDEIEQFVPMLQSIAIPRTTRHDLRDSEHPKVLEAVREAILDRLPDADVEAENITRFGWRTIISLVLGLVAVVVILTVFNTQDVLAALEDTNPWWLLVALGFDLLTFTGAALAMLAFAPIKLPWGRVLLVQAAAAYLALAAPAGVGPAALNLRMLTKRKVPTPLALATVALVQVSAVVVTVGALVALTLLTGSQGTLAALPSTAILIGVGITAGVVALALTAPRVRKWAASRALPLVRQTWPRLSQILGQPWRFALGLGGNLVLAIGYVGAFYSTLLAFGQHLAIIDVAVLFFLSNAVGAIVPTPGGLGAVEIALTAGLTGAGLPAALALSVATIYRLISYWLRIPMGYFSMKFLQRRGEL